jgi:hypothetical protein
MLSILEVVRPRWQPLIAHLVATLWQNAGRVSWQATVAMVAVSCDSAVAAALVFRPWGLTGLILFLALGEGKGVLVPPLCPFKITIQMYLEISIFLKP